MTRFVVALGPVVLASCLAFACSSTDDHAEPVAVDAGVDATLPPPPPPPPDAGEADTARPDIQPASRLEVACAQDPCYVAVSGNVSEHVCGLLKDGTVRCWGRDSRPRAAPPPDAGSPETDGALGRGQAVSALEGATPAPVVGLTDATQISVGTNLGTCARTKDGAVYCWGRNEFGQLGRPATEVSLAVPTRIEGLPPVSFVALGGSIGCAMASEDGALWCWGARNSQVGRAATPGEAAWFPPQVMTGFRPPLRELAIGTMHGSAFKPYEDTVVALLDDGTLATLGEAPAGTSSIAPAAAPVPHELHGVVRVGAFGYLSKDGVLSRWMPDTRALYVPSASTVVDVAITTARGDFGAVYVEQAGVLLSTGRLFRWGRNLFGALGAPEDALDVAEEPLEMAHVVGDGVVSFATTAASTCVSLVDGTVKCWGSNQHGELGRGTIDADEHPEAQVIR